MSQDTFISAPRDCKKCELHINRTQVVFPDVFYNSDYSLTTLIIGEAPGANEDKEGKPFVGSSGKILRRELEKLPGRIIITNTVKCRPPENRNPRSAEKKACNEFLLKELEHYNPDLIILVGRVSSSLYLDTESLKNFSNFSGTLFQEKYIPILHPASTMYNRKKNMPIWEESWKKISEIIVEKFPDVTFPAPKEPKELPKKSKQSVKSKNSDGKVLTTLNKFLQDVD